VRLSARYSLRPLFREGQRNCKTRTRNRAAGMRFHVFSAVVLRESGAPSIPEASQMNSAVSEILGRPVKPDDDSGMLFENRSRKLRAWPAGAALHLMNLRSSPAMNGVPGVTNAPRTNRSFRQKGRRRDADGLFRGKCFSRSKCQPPAPGCPDSVAQARGVVESKPWFRETEHRSRGARDTACGAGATSERCVQF
jgi:hypothetical protein